GIALHADGFVVDAVELALGDIAVIAPQFLLGAQLHAVVGKLAFATLAVLAGTIFAAVDGTLRAAPHLLPPTAGPLFISPGGPWSSRPHGLLFRGSRPPLSRLCRNRQVLAEAAGKTAGSRNAAQASKARAARGF